MGAVLWPQVQFCPAAWQLGDAGRRLPLLGLPVPHLESRGDNSAGFMEAPAKEVPSSNVWHGANSGTASSGVRWRPEGRRAPGHGSDLVLLAGDSSAWTRQSECVMEVLLPKGDRPPLQTFLHSPGPVFKAKHVWASVFVSVNEDSVVTPAPHSVEEIFFFLVFRTTL